MKMREKHIEKTSQCTGEEEFELKKENTIGEGKNRKRKKINVGEYRVWNGEKDTCKHKHMKD